MSEFNNISSIVELLEEPMSVLAALFDASYSYDKASRPTRHIAVVLATLYRDHLLDDDYIKVYDVLVTHNTDYEVKSMFKTGLDKRIDEVRVRHNELQEDQAYKKELNTYLN